MSFSVGDVLRATRDMHPAFMPEQHPDSLCWRFLSRYVRTLTNRLADIAPREVAQTTAQVTVAGLFANGISLSSQNRVIEVVARPKNYQLASDRVPVEILPAGNRFAGTTAGPWVYILGTTIYPGPRQEYWDLYYDIVVAHLLALFTDVQNNDTSIPLPSDALDVCAAQLAYFLAKREASRVEAATAPPRYFKDDADDAERVFLERFANQKSSQVWSIRRVRD